MHEYVVAKLQAVKGRWREVAEDTDVSKRSIEKIASGEWKNPGVKTIEVLARYFREREHVSH